MRFDSFIENLDMGQCEDQMHRETIFDIVLMIVMIDGVIDESERVFMENWLESLQWNSEISAENYYDAVVEKIHYAVANDQAMDFISHRAKLIKDQDVRDEALKLARDVSIADGQLDDKEREAIQLLTDLLEDKR